MRVKSWLLLGGIVGLVVGLLVDALLELPLLEMRLLQVGLVLFGAVVAAFVFEGAKAVTSGMNPNVSTDGRRRRWFVRRSRAL
jgi:hypothetical protein